jgi:hypothetical protein
MADVTWPSISSAADETVARLDALFLADRARRSASAEFLTTAVARLGEASEPWREEVVAPPPATRRDAPPPPAMLPAVSLPERTTHGGPFGPKVRAKLIAEATADRW